MKTIILAGGLGTRLSEETVARPKPMVEIGEWPILVHIMQIYAAAGHTDFLVACGYKADFIKDYFLNFGRLGGDLFVDLASGKVEHAGGAPFPWRVGCVETGDKTMTGGRVRRLKRHVGEETFMVTYGDGVGDVDVEALLAFHRAHGKLATVTAVRPPARFGALRLEGATVTAFNEKAQSDVGWINGGFFVFEPGVFDLIDGDATSLEVEPMRRLVAQGQLEAYQHDGFWQPMDTVRERDHLRDLWDRGEAPWKLA